ncbi:type II toxin-antitoxin system RelE/ParE family toxin [Paraburkholderia sp. MMS20-SJTR3]|uniref:Type II toxin-antitoxin system RelE/ParE family toxin n=1 Tax=Paraburkholderia sejongensis TaxID=2886946 RepID=A0ABS8K445_9BURK|nr:type II toxin-antitoxin system RelE/ParE family toxin [Paraburkholderia sp. MMS20-SJTR3]MCC8396931.1 type II toxin-antitoxin system RelE/ParE family toxin [Paraburkholderia sp. MMS20-SJTR3]
MTARAVWTVRVSTVAQDDFSRIIGWTTREFGPQQARVYSQTLRSTLRDMAAGPALTGVAARDDIAPGLLTLHVARKGRKGRHFVMFRVVSDETRVLDVVRILHDAMDPALHIPSS